MIPQRITIENFLSFGPETVFTFDESEPLWVLSGPNGVGKSTVFDAITYALFGCHRGGIHKADLLIRHGTNGFRVVFEFSFNGESIRVTRSRTTKKKGPIEAVEKYDASLSEWVHQEAPDVTEWVERKIGMTVASFTLSVLLKQGEADGFINATAGKRMELLKKIVQLEPYEELYTRVHRVHDDCLKTQKQLKAQHSNMNEVMPAELLNAEEQVTAATEAKEKAAEGFHAAQQLVGQGTQYRQASARRAELTKLLQAAEGRAGRAEAIRTGYLRWTELGQVVPTLEKLEPLPAKLKLQEERLAECRSKETAAQEQYQTAERSVEELESQRNGLEQAKAETKERVSLLERQQKEIATQLNQVKELAEAETMLAAFPKTLEKELTGFTEEMNTLGKTITERGNEIHALKVQVDQQTKQLRDFSKVKTGVPCSRCGQEVSKKHAAEETKRLEGLIGEAEKQLNVLQKEQDGHEATQAELKKQQGKLEVQMREMSSAKTRVETLQRTLRNQNITATLPELETKQAEVERELPVVRSQATEAVKAYEAHITTINDLVAERRATQSTWNQAKQNASSAFNELDKLRFEQATYLSQLPEAWKAHCPIDRTMLLGLQQELAALVKQNIAAENDQLSRDAGEVTARREEYERQQKQLKELPDEAKLPEAELQQRVQGCKTQHTTAEQEYQAAVRGRDELLRRQTEHARHATALKAAEEKLRLHKRLDELLGRDGLQRKLVRNAEKELTASASQTLGKLTHGELSLDLNPEGKGDEAFDLIVRQRNNSHTTSVNYLSGSQKFRVSVALALAIGQYASGRNRPLESVIIDEGFGSLDRDGLDAMARELRELQRSAALKRIILVSHQDDFVQNFPVGYQLTPGDQGTTAERWSR